MVNRSVQPPHRIVQSVDVWSVAKVSLPFYAAVVAVVVGIGVVFWALLVGAGATGDFERFIVEDVGYANFEFLPDQMFRAAVTGGLILVVVGTASNILLAVLFNILSDMIGGVRLITVERPIRRRTPKA